VLDETPELAAAGLVLRHEFVSAAEEAALLEIADEHLAAVPYADDHYDSVIKGYRECAVSVFPDPHAEAAVQRMRLTAWRATDGAPRRGSGMYPHVQFIDLPPDGQIRAHRDNMKLFGEFTCGLNLLSSAVMRFRPCRPTPTQGEEEEEGEAEEGEGVIDVLLRPRSLYVMHGPLRWHYTHEVLDAAASAEVWRKQPAEEGCGGEERGRRISVIARDLGKPGVFGVEW